MDAILKGKVKAGPYRGRTLRGPERRTRECGRCSPPLRPSSGMGLDKDVALITDGRFSGGPAERPSATSPRRLPTAGLDRPGQKWRPDPHRYSQEKADPPGQRRRNQAQKKALEGPRPPDQIRLCGPLCPDGHLGRDRGHIQGQVLMLSLPRSPVCGATHESAIAVIPPEEAVRETVPILRESRTAREQGSPLILPGAAFTASYREFLTNSGKFHKIFIFFLTGFLICPNL